MTALPEWGAGGTLPGPLAGVRVVDFTHVLAGPACAYQLALLGADVVKVERPGRGDAMRHRGGTDPERAARGESTAYLTQSAHKRSAILDLDQPEGRAAMEALLAGADVLVENHRPSTLRRMGLDWPDLHARHPRLIHCAMTGYGRGHARADAPAYDVNIQAASGLMALTGTAETGPTRVGAPVIDYATALAAAFGVCAALVGRARTGGGSLVDVSMMDVALTLMSSMVVDYALTGHAPRPRGNAANSRSPSAGTFPTADGLLSLGVNEAAQFERLAVALDRARWLDDPRFADAAAREAHRAALSEEIAAALAGRSAAAWEDHLLAAAVPAARVATLPEALEGRTTGGRPHPIERGSEPSAGRPFIVRD
ncbi:MAG: CaiB/BaiF CoA transferase family protein [Hasllibacter sp.]